jgi:hypothetical protein
MRNTFLQILGAFISNLESKGLIDASRVVLDDNVVNVDDAHDVGGEGVWQAGEEEQADGRSKQEQEHQVEARRSSIASGRWLEKGGNTTTLLFLDLLRFHFILARLLLGLSLSLGATTKCSSLHNLNHVSWLL